MENLIATVGVLISLINDPNLKPSNSPAIIQKHYLRCVLDSKTVFLGHMRSDIKIWTGKRGVNGFKFINAKNERYNTVYANKCHF